MRGRDGGEMRGRVRHFEAWFCESCRVADGQLETIGWEADGSLVAMTRRFHETKAHRRKRTCS